MRRIFCCSTSCATCCTTELYIFSPKEKSVMSIVCESEVSETKACLYRCTMWKAHQELFNGTVHQLCPISFLSEITDRTSELQIECGGDETEIYASAHHMKALKNMRAEWCLSTLCCSPSMRPPRSSVMRSITFAFFRNISSLCQRNFDTPHHVFLSSALVQHGNVKDPCSLR